MHRPFARTVASVAPSTAVQMTLTFAEQRASYADEPTGLCVHRLVGGGLVSHVLPTGPRNTWIPGWALDDAP
jgi:hypothetical protein